MRQRLQKLVAAAGKASRREAELWIQQGRISVNGQIAQLGDSADPELDRIEIDGKSLCHSVQHYYVLLNKPSGYVTTRHDPQGRPCVVDLVKDIPARLNPVGRLDLTTEGLLLLTNDGQFAHQLMHPRHEVGKTYLVRVRGNLHKTSIFALENGVMLDDGMTAPAKIAHIRHSGSHTTFELTIHEGRNRQVRRMCEAVGCPVSRLRRIRLAFLELGTLKPGNYRFLAPIEVAKLLAEKNSDDNLTD